MLRQFERGTALSLCRRFRQSDDILSRICLMHRMHCDTNFCTVPHAAIVYRDCVTIITS